LQKQADLAGWKHSDRISLPHPPPDLFDPLRFRYTRGLPRRNHNSRHHRAALKSFFGELLDRFSETGFALVADSRGHLPRPHFQHRGCSLSNVMLERSEMRTTRARKREPHGVLPTFSPRHRELLCIDAITRRCG
jgi:hypothetical protein